MGAKIDLLGKKFGRLTVLSQSDSRVGGNVFWNCECDCGKACTTSSILLRRGDTRSCGCLFIETAVEKGRARKTHGLTQSRAYHSWVGLKERCLNRNNPKYELYGGRGIKVCERWLNSFENFFQDMGHPPDGFSLDRIDVNGDYRPENCRWANNVTQSNNRRTNKMVPYGERQVTLAEYERLTGLSQDALHLRLKRGWSMTDALKY